MRLDHNNYLFGLIYKLIVLCLQQSDMHCHAIIMNISVAIARRSHPFPSRTRKLSSFAPMVLHGRLCGRVGAAGFKTWRPFEKSKGLFYVVLKFPYALLHGIPHHCSVRRKYASFLGICAPCLWIILRRLAWKVSEYCHRVLLWISKLQSRPHSSRFVRLASGAFYDAAETNV